MARNLFRRTGIWVFRMKKGGKDWRVSTGFKDRKTAMRRAAEIEVQIRSGLHGWTRNVVAFGPWSATYLERYTPRKRDGRRDGQILATCCPAGHIVRWRTSHAASVPPTSTGERQREPSRVRSCER